MNRFLCRLVLSCSVALSTIAVAQLPTNDMAKRQDNLSDLILKNTSRLQAGRFLKVQSTGACGGCLSNAQGTFCCSGQAARPYCDTNGCSCEADAQCQ